MQTEVETPFYFYHASSIEDQVRALCTTLKTHVRLPFHIRYAVKANPNVHIIRILKRMNCGVEVVSYGEYIRAVTAGLKPSDIVVSGVGKTEAELLNAVCEGVDQISVESVEELALIASFQKACRISLRLNPNINAETHEKITTATENNKFGILENQLPQCFEIIKENPQLNFLGFSIHLGSQIWMTHPYETAFQKLRSLVIYWNECGFKSTRLDLGGGFAVDYTQQNKKFPLEEYAKIISKTLDDLGCEYIIEPGRFLVAEAGQLITKVLYVKKTPHKTFVIVDAAMNDMMRWALYGAQHPITTLGEKTLEHMTVDVVGPVCESTDCFGKNIQVPANLQRGHMLSIGVTGAYGASLSSTYNSRPLIGEYLEDGGRIYCIRPPILPPVFLTFEEEGAVL